MEEFIFNIFFSSLLSGVIFLIAAIISHTYPPKKINYMYGYRTNAAMRSPERWNFAQRYSTRQMIKAAIGLIVVSPCGYLMPDSIIKFIVDVALVIAAAVYIIFTTEKAIKRQFPE